MVRPTNSLEETNKIEGHLAMSTPPGYEKKFGNFIKLCADSKVNGVGEIAAGYPWVLGDNYEELIESLSRLADAGLSLRITARKDWPSRN